MSGFGRRQAAAIVVVAREKQRKSCVEMLAIGERKWDGNGEVSAARRARLFPLFSFFCKERQRNKWIYCKLVFNSDTHRRRTHTHIHKSAERVTRNVTESSVATGQYNNRTNRTKNFKKWDWPNSHKIVISSSCVSHWFWCALHLRFASCSAFIRRSSCI